VDLPLDTTTRTRRPWVPLLPHSCSRAGFPLALLSPPNPNCLGDGLARAAPFNPFENPPRRGAQPSLRPGRGLGNDAPAPARAKESVLGGKLRGAEGLGVGGPRFRISDDNESKAKDREPPRNGIPDPRSPRQPPYAAPHRHSSLLSYASRSCHGYVTTRCAGKISAVRKASTAPQLPHVRVEDDTAHECEFIPNLRNLPLSIWICDFGLAIWPNYLSKRSRFLPSP